MGFSNRTIYLLRDEPPSDAELEAVFAQARRESDEFERQNRVTQRFLREVEFTI